MKHNLIAEPNPRRDKSLSALAVGGVLASFAGSAHAMVGFDDILLFLPIVLMKLVTAIFIILAAILYVGQFIFTQILVKIAILMMPIMVPFIMLEKTRFLFEGWFKFLITAGMTKIVGAIMFGIMAANVNQAVALVEKAVVQDDAAMVSFITYSSLLLLTGLTAYMMTQTQQIGNSLVSGFVQGGFRFSPVGQAAAMSRGMPSGAASAANRIAGGVAGGMAGGAKAGSEAFKSAGGAAGGVKAAMSAAAQSMMPGMKGGAKGTAEGIQKGAAKMLGEKLGVSKAPSGTATSGGATSAPGPQTPIDRARANLAKVKSGSGR